MATIKGVLRTYGAAVRRAEKQQQRRAREATKRYKEQLKQEEIANVVDAVADYNDYVELIQSLHKNCTEEVDWDLIRDTPHPETPLKQAINELKAQRQLEEYKPSLIDKLFGGSKVKKENLENELARAKRIDESEFQAHYRQYEEELADWNSLQEMAKGIDNWNPELYRDVLRYFDPFSDIGELGSQMNFMFSDNMLDIDLHVNGQDIVPNYELKQTSTGKLSKKAMSKTKYNELYQDYVCSALIRVSREVFAYLPIEKIRINALTKLVNSSTGHLEDTVIVSVIMVLETILSLNMESIDPSDSLENFIHNMKFSKTKGFLPVEKANLE